MGKNKSLLLGDSKVQNDKVKICSKNKIFTCFF